MDNDEKVNKKLEDKIDNYQLEKRERDTAVIIQNDNPAVDEIIAINIAEQQIMDNKLIIFDKFNWN